ncbi:hypothetical protein BDM02DRAFT_3217429 [Thelephora ganbajun]|uniref:Uncharacterized protein n=1 Tax=Thelephora ganbajun TaxID=370292 RepID=A0ACB6ZN59_THEGA|nr:hypothetical protein BDM02DRAFT_3217429 [Thelephora ganbajun]
MSSPTSHPESRLPLNVKPTHYDLTIRTNLENQTFDGFVDAHLDILQDTSELTFNSSDLTLSRPSVYSEALASSIDVDTSITFNGERGRATVKLAKILPAGSKAKFKIAYEGKLLSNMTGYYKSVWDHDGKKDYYSLTQFEATSARRAFPCWDEPLLKATFSVTMISRANTINLSNMPVESEKVYSTGTDSSDNSLASSLAALSIGEVNDQWKITRFEKSPPMSTYLVAYANGVFEYLESSYTSPLSGKTRPLPTPNFVPLTQFALDVKAKTLPLYEKIFDIEYPLPKLDTLVASDFDAGAMENWGLITGRTSAFLVDPEKTDLAGKQNVAATQSHEVAHMWFGDIVTMKWWDNLYLNEGMMGEVIIIDKIFPEWNVHSDFIGTHLNAALLLDSKLSSHPIEVDVPDAEQIDQIFDSLSYSKAGSVLRMLANYVGEEVFLKGVSIYLKEHLYGNSITNDLWSGIAKASGTDVPEMMNNWVTEVGYPVIKVIEVEGGIHVRQDRFLESGPAEEKDNQTIWAVPLSLLSAGKDGKSTIDNSLILDTREKFIPLDTTKPYKLNANTTGVYRVLYSPDITAKISAEAAKVDSIFSLNNRIGLVLDSVALAKAGFSDTSSMFTLIDGLRGEKEYLVWHSISDGFAHVTNAWWENEEILDLSSEFVRVMYRPLVKRLGFEYPAGEHPSTTKLRTEVINVSAIRGDEEVIKELQSRFNHLIETGDDSRIPPDLEAITYRIAVKHGGREQWEFVKGINEAGKTPTSRIAAIRALGHTQDLNIAKETLDYMWAKAKDQDFHYFFFGLSNNTKTKRLLRSYVFENYDKITARFAGNSLYKYLIQGSIGSFSSEKDAQDIEEFFKDKDNSKYDMVLAQSLDGIRARAKWCERSTVELKQWLENWKKRSGGA